LKVLTRYFLLCVTVLFLATSCGYHNPYVYSGPEISIYITNWKNRTSELNLDSKIYQSLIKWYQKSGSIKVKREREGADLILGGEIVSMDIPSLSYGANNTTTQVEAHLTVRYILKNLKSGKVLVESPRKVYTETYLVTSDSTVTSDNESKALDKIIDDLSESIYLQTLNSVRRR
jgi:hypothetical protein